MSRSSLHPSPQACALDSCKGARCADSCLVSGHKTRAADGDQVPSHAVAALGWQSWPLTPACRRLLLLPCITCAAPGKPVCSLSLSPSVAVAA